MNHEMLLKFLGLLSKRVSFAKLSLADREKFVAFLGNVAKQAEQSNSVAAKSNLANNIREFASNGFYLQKNKELYVSILKGLNLPNLVNSIYQLAINNFNVNPFTEQIMKLNL